MFRWIDRGIKYDIFIWCSSTRCSTKVLVSAVAVERHNPWLTKCSGAEFAPSVTLWPSLEQYKSRNSYPNLVQINSGLERSTASLTCKAVEESEESSNRELISGADMAFITAGKGGGSGTVPAPVIATVAAAFSRCFDCRRCKHVHLPRNGKRGQFAVEGDQWTSRTRWYFLISQNQTTVEMLT